MGERGVEPNVLFSVGLHTTTPYNTLATWCKELTHRKRPWCWERLKVGGEGKGRWWDGWMALPTQWTSVWVSSRSWWWTGKPGVLQSMGSQRVGHDWATELNWYSYSVWSELSRSVCWRCRWLSNHHIKRTRFNKYLSHLGNWGLYKSTSSVFKRQGIQNKDIFCLSIVLDRHRGLENELSFCSWNRPIQLL